MGYQLSVGTGGTFADVVIVDRMAMQTTGKALTTPERGFGGVHTSLSSQLILTTSGDLASPIVVYGAVLRTDIEDASLDVDEDGTCARRLNVAATS